MEMKQYHQLHFDFLFFHKKKRVTFRHASPGYESELSSTLKGALQSLPTTPNQQQQTTAQGDASS